MVKQAMKKIKHGDKQWLTKKQCQQDGRIGSPGSSFLPQTHWLSKNSWVNFLCEKSEYSCTQGKYEIRLKPVRRFRKLSSQSYCLWFSVVWPGKDLLSPNFSQRREKIGSCIQYSSFIKVPPLRDGFCLSDTPKQKLK